MRTTNEIKSDLNFDLNLAFFWDLKDWTEFIPIVAVEVLSPPEEDE